jgi:hypothetical protein
MQTFASPRVPSNKNEKNDTLGNNAQNNKNNYIPIGATQHEQYQNRNQEPVSNSSV